MSLQSRVCAPAQADRVRSRDLAFISSRPVGWSCRRRRPVEDARKVEDIRCSAKP
jgi:hypothetical protein